jgi:predicted AAA+ superfamily ATPase
MERDLKKHLLSDIGEKITLLSGPRQVGKTTLSHQLNPAHVYLNYDSPADRKIISAMEWRRDCKIVIFDELHKMKNWKSWIKGLYDTEGTSPNLLVTGSARLEAYRKSGDSLAGRFFSYRLHPLTVKEICHHLDEESPDALEKLLTLGGFPEPYLKNSPAFAKRWRRTHVDTIIREDLLDLEKVRDIKSIEILIDLLRSRVGSATSYTSLANDLQVSVHTVKHWLQILENLYLIFAVRPYHKNIARSILKEAKYYFYDTGDVVDTPGARLENTVACALLRELHLHEDTIGARVGLHYLRDKEKHEVDFLTVIDGFPEQMIEVKTGDNNFSRSLLRFKKILPSAAALQVVHKLRQHKNREGVKMVPADDFLKNLSIRKE